ncbi:pilus assembly protein N-terminal domain-containing protein [Aliihoeflea sp. 2WW]|uniref:pilus assembly protein N-terminal domain-containing protein n=1 Tax=Aliihoeflea sp. 2WW TaxID=1381123 RepID=UPI0004653050|nr:pilus assembly protein N-terminal domain-containing protein [Aliihoeflea sp. 2WW]
MARSTKSIRFFAGLALTATASVLAAPAFAEAGISVLVNQAKIVKLARNADTIIVGNPEIADASVQDASTLVLTGKGFGVTNLVVLDAEGRPIVDEQVTVSRQSVNSVRIYRRAAVQTLSCTPVCEAAYVTEAEAMSDTTIGVP